MRGALVVVCGLQAEARIIGRDGLVLLVGGGDRARLEAELSRVALGACGLLSVGVAGGLAPGLRPGDVRVADSVFQPSGERAVANPRWAAAIADCLCAPVLPMAGVDEPLSDVAGKAELFRRTGAHTVDMESHLVARAAVANGVPFAAIRVVTDPAERQLPHAATVGMRADGKVDLAAILTSLARNPAQLPALIRTGLDARAAFGALLRCRQRLGADFARFDLA